MPPPILRRARHLTGTYVYLVSVIYRGLDGVSHSCYAREAYKLKSLAVAYINAMKLNVAFADSTFYLNRKLNNGRFRHGHLPQADFLAYTLQTVGILGYGPNVRARVTDAFGSRSQGMWVQQINIPLPTSPLPLDLEMHLGWWNHDENMG